MVFERTNQSLKPTQERSDLAAALLQELFNRSVSAPSDYEVLYAPYHDALSFFSLKKAACRYYLLGYNITRENFVLLEFDTANEALAAGPVYYFTRQDIQSFKRNIYGCYVLKLQEGSQFKLMIMPYTTNTYIFAVRQEELAMQLLTTMKYWFQ